MPTSPKEPPLHFEVSSGLKSILGSELITDEQVAIFELVKNSFDAEARTVDLYFDDNQIVIADDGAGMSFDDIKDRWLLVAYSEKRNATRSDNFRDSISARRAYAGSKGIGRFSTDRLGHLITLQTKPQTPKSGPVHRVTINWDEFDKDPHQQRFEKLPLEYATQLNGFELPNSIQPRQHGTVITIHTPRQDWDRQKILSLKAALAKLINPFGNETDDFKIIIHAPYERDQDRREEQSSESNSNRVVNGEVGNFIFETLEEKTTFLDVSINHERGDIESKLVDRGELIYRIREPNVYPELSQSGFHCRIFFLNRSAKHTFAVRMGVPSVQFGSVFLFRNGFRVYPIGNEGDDWFGMDRRKQQGYARFLGTRDVIGRIDITAQSERDFQESSSRNDGLISSPAVRELQACFWEHCLKRLERYVVPVTFADKGDTDSSDISRLLTPSGRARVTSAVARLVDDKNVKLLAYSENLISILDDRSSQFEPSLSGLRAIAEKTQDRVLYQNIEKAEKRFDEARRSEESARRQAEEERRAREAVQAQAEEVEQLHQTAITNLNEERKRNLFLSSIAAVDKDTILNLHHQVSIYAVDIQQQIENFLVRISGRDQISAQDASNVLEKIALLNRKVMGIAKFATKANFRLETEQIEADLGEYVEQYIRDVAGDFLSGSIRATVTNDGKGFVQRFKPIDLTIVVDNLISNARKSRASNISFEISHPRNAMVHIRVVDDGRGFDQRITDPERVFEKGFTTTHGSGLGLFHVRHVLGEMKGTIEARAIEGKRGAEFLIRIAK